MQEIKKGLALPRLKYYEMHLSIMNCVLPIKMTPMEMTVIASFMCLNGDLANYRFGPTAKKKIMEDLKLSPSGLSNHLNSLTDKGFLTKAGDFTSFLPLLIPEESQQDYRFRIVNQN